MKFTASLLIVALACFGALFANEIQTENGILVLTGENYHEAVEKFDKLLIDHYAPWCPYCKLLLPQLEKAAVQLKELKAEAKIAKLDCTVHEKICDELDLKYYPTMFVYTKGVRTEYKSDNGIPTASDIVGALLNKFTARSVSVCKRY